MTFQRWVRIALGYLGFISLQIGVWALIAPQSFYDDFPGLGRAWVSVDGPYNEHLVRDVGALNLALTALFVAAMVRVSRDLVTIAGVVTLLWGVPHTMYHALNTDGLGAGDVTVSLLGLTFSVIVGGGLIYAAPRVERESIASA